MLGGKCVKCGYHKSLSALSFHHINPKNKLFDLSHNGNLMHDWEEVVAEAKKCILLRLNCHAETDNGMQEFSLLPLNYIGMRICRISCKNEEELKEHIHEALLDYIDSVDKGWNYATPEQLSDLKRF